MIASIFTTASVLKAMLCFIDPTTTPKIAFDREDMVEPLIAKVKECLGDRDGSQEVIVTFRDGDEEVKRQFVGVCDNIGAIFSTIVQTLD
jgi:hypothetical protein